MCSTWGYLAPHWLLLDLDRVRMPGPGRIDNNPITRRKPAAKLLYACDGGECARAHQNVKGRGMDLNARDEPVDLVDDDHVDLPGGHIGPQTPQRRALGVAARMAAVVIALPVD